MCGICGFVGAGTSDDLARMNALLVHRGPDGAGVWRAATAAVYLASRRLAVVDLPGGSQPMETPDGELVIVFNGEIYNHAELRHQLQGRGHHFQTDHSDTEVLLFGYREWGPGMVSKLNGMWAFALYDRARSRLFCSRDRFGKKPFYYAAAKDSFVFASELTSLAAHPAVDRTVSHRALQKYFGYGYIPAPHSIFSGARKLPAGHSLFLDVGAGTIRLEKYWDFELEPFETIPSNAEQEWGGHIRELLDRSVHRRLVADVPIGVFLSGGIDSSAVTAFASRHLAAGRLKTFSVGFDEETFDESKFGERVSAEFQSDHRTEALSAEGADALAEKCLSQLDEPMGDNSLLPTYLLSQFTRKQVTVALGGDGSDELFCGYDPFRALRWADWYQTLVPKPIHAAIKALFYRMPVSHASMALDFKIKRTLRGLDHAPRLWLPVWMAPLDQNSLAELFGASIDLEDVFSEAIEQWDNCRQPDLLDKTLQFYTKLYLQDDILTKVDRASMMHSLEVRAPFLDIELVDFVRRIPSRYKFRHGTTKYILKHALTEVLPRDILHRRKKGFGTPAGAWFKKGLLHPEATAMPSFDKRVVARKIADHRAGKVDATAFLWAYLALEKWSAARRVAL